VRGFVRSGMEIWPLTERDLIADREGTRS